VRVDRLIRMYSAPAKEDLELNFRCNFVAGALRLSA
jgi:hypothetical protein